MAGWAVRIPFVEAFRDAARDRAWYEAVVVRVEDESGEVGYGEGAPRRSAGESPEEALRRVADGLWPALADTELPEIQTAEDIIALGQLLQASDRSPAGIGAGSCALELAILDCGLRTRNRCMVNVLPPARQRVVYGGLIAATTEPAGALAQVKQLKAIGLRAFKLEVGLPDDIERIRAVRDAIGLEASLRLDARGAWTAPRALDVLWAVAACGIEAVEQPLPPGSAAELARFKRECPVPVMADESLVTPADAEALIAAGAVDFFNIGVSKCGGLSGALQIVRMARRHGIRYQIGSQVGETAVLSAAGRHLAAYCEDVAFVEGSCGTLLLSDDISPDGIRFGHRGEAGVLLGKGLGVRVLDERLQKYAVKHVTRMVSQVRALKSGGLPRPKVLPPVRKQSGDSTGSEPGS